MVILLFSPINAFYLINYPNFEGDKIGSQRWSGTHPKSPRELKAEPGQKPGVLATSQGFTQEAFSGLNAAMQHHL